MTIPAVSAYGRRRDHLVPRESCDGGWPDPGRRWSPPDALPLAMLTGRDDRSPRSSALDGPARSSRSAAARVCTVAHRTDGRRRPNPIRYRTATVIGAQRRTPQSTPPNNHRPPRPEPALPHARDLNHQPITERNNPAMRRRRVRPPVGPLCSASVYASPALNRRYRSECWIAPDRNRHRECAMRRRGQHKRVGNHPWTDRPHDSRSSRDRARARVERGPGASRVGSGSGANWGRARAGAGGESMSGSERWQPVCRISCAGGSGWCSDRDCRAGNF